ncbi:MAG: hypothetical protein JOS17DRAFT_740990 [Linnemannia elongata]|nr:MAG: hypothetical protein JOS17DRAFT_740990 [Linnemannia elongata]
MKPANFLLPLFLFALTPVNAVCPSSTTCANVKNGNFGRCGDKGCLCPLVCYKCCYPWQFWCKRRSRDDCLSCLCRI